VVGKVFLLASLVALRSAAQVSFTPLPFRTSPAIGVVAADFNSDGKPDVAVLERSATATVAGSVYLGKGDGTFQPALGFGLPSADLIATGDFNGDGHPDLALGSFATGMITILLGKGDGTFQAAVSFPGVVNLSAMCAGDWNGDHKTDLALLDRNDSGLTILQSRGDGTFDASALYTIPHNSVNACLAADFNGDGKPDIAVVSGILLGPSSEGFLSVFLGNGDSTFQALDGLAIAVGANSLVTGDFNQDGKTDVAVTGFGQFPYYNSVIQVLAGVGDGTFSLVFSTPDPFGSTGISYSNLTVADFSGDGKVDFMGGSVNGLGFLAGNGDGTFQDLVLSDGPVNGGLATGDFNQDGKPDTASADTVYLNTSPAVGAHINSNGVVNAASWQTPALAPGSLISIYGSGLTLAQSPPQPGASALILNGTETALNGVPVPLLFVSPGQVNAQVPWELTGAIEATLTISVSGVPGQTFKGPVVADSPGIFTLDAEGHGAVFIVVSGNPIAAPTGTLPGARPVQRGESIQIFGTGFGPVTNQPATGDVSPFNPLARTNTPPSIDLEGVSAPVSFSGLAPGAIGVYQINALVPQTAPVGDSIVLKATIAGFASNTVLIAIR
jgi:uncharacterized protein (TIGR03437 family)